MTTRHAARRPPPNFNAPSFGLSALGTTLAGAPWWTTSLLICAALACALAQIVFPQESAHRLQWWRDRRLVRMQTRPRPPIDSTKPKKHHELDSGCDLDLASQQDDSNASGGPLEGS